MTYPPPPSPPGGDGAPGEYAVPAGLPPAGPPPGPPPAGPPPGGYAPPGGYGAPSMPPPPGYGPPGGFPPPRPTNGLAIAALILGILSLVGGLVPFLGWAMVPFALTAVGLGIAGMSRARTIGEGKGLAIGGLVTGVLALLAILAWTIAIVWLIDRGADAVDDFECRLDRDRLTTAVRGFRAAEGREPTSEGELVSTGHLTESSHLYDVELRRGTATVVAEPGRGCD